jgi:hypothetical protein
MVTVIEQETFALTAYLTRRNNARQCPALSGMSPNVDTLAALLPRYPYLYRHTTRTAHMQKADVEPLQQTMQAKFEVRLSRYLIEQMRRSQAPYQAAVPGTATRTQTTQKNPTLLSYFGIQKALKRFTAPVWGTESHAAVARRFLAQTQKNTFFEFKQNLCAYLLASLPANVKLQKFSLQLKQRLDAYLPENDDQPMNPFLLTAICRNLFQFLTVNGARQMNHYVLIDLVGHLNPFFMAELFLRILLLCPSSRVHLDKRLALLFKQYADLPQAEVTWLVQLLEYLNLVYSTHFGKVTVPLAALVKVAA